jgi:uncharacterized repeat protein (TIGR01451 family)
LAAALATAGLVAGLVGIAGVASPAAALPPTVPVGPAFDCETSTIFVAQVVAGPAMQLSKLEAGSGSSSFSPVGSPSATLYNSIAYDPASDQIIGNSTTGNLVAVGSDGVVHSLGPVGFTTLAGAIDGNTYYASAGDNVLRRVDLTTLATSTVGLSAAAPTGDFTVIDGLLWGQVAQQQQLIRINPANGQVTTFPAPFIAAGTTAGAAWTYGNGNLGLSNNADGTIYQIEITGGSTATPTFNLLATSDGPSSFGNDGTSCEGEPADLGVTKSSTSPVGPGGTITWTITVTNNGPGDSSGYVVADTIPAGVTAVASSTPGCTVGATAVTCVGGILPAGDSDVITITGKAPGATGTVTNEVIVIGNEDDPDLANNAATSDTAVTATISGLCRGTSLQVLGLRLGSANNPESPCVTATDNVVFVNQPLGPSFPLLGLISVLRASAVGSNTLANPRLAAAESHVAAAVVNLPFLGLNLAVTGVQTTATATMPPGTCGAPTLAGTSIVASLVLNGSVLVVGKNPVSIPLLGLGGVYLNQRVVQGNTITQRAVFVDLPGTTLDITIAESKAAISCS